MQEIIILLAIGNISLAGLYLIERSTSKRWHELFMISDKRNNEMFLEFIEAHKEIGKQAERGSVELEMKKELKEIFGGFAQINLLELNKEQLSRLSQDDVYILTTHDLALLDGKIKTEREELLIGLGEENYYRIKHDEDRATAFELELYNKLKEIEHVSL